MSKSGPTGNSGGSNGIAPNTPSSPIVFRTIKRKRDANSPMRFFAEGFDARQELIDRIRGDLSPSDILGSARIDEIMAPLNAMCGQHEMKRIVRRIVENIQMQRLRAMANIKPRTSPLHLVFTGAPGTGKTTAARIISRILQECGYTDNDQFREVGRVDLIGEYIGESEQKTRKILQSVKGGVLFIDEAYSLNKAESGRDYGRDVINLLVAEMDKPDFRTVIICAGYTEPMKLFMAANPGLKSRFSHIIPFHAYALPELMQITNGMLDDAEYKMTPTALMKFENTLRERLRQGLIAEGSARSLRQLIDETIANQATRFLSLKTPNLRDMSTIEAVDIPGDASAVISDKTPENQCNVVPFRR